MEKKQENTEKMTEQDSSIENLRKYIEEGVVSKLQSGFTETKHGLDEVKNSLEFAHKSIERIELDLQIERKEKQELKKKLEILEGENTVLHSELKKLKDRVIDQENRNRRNNLEFEGVLEDPGETNVILENKIKSLLQKKVGIQLGPYDIDRCHRIGPPAQGRLRTVIVRFLCYKQREEVWRGRTKLKGTNVYVNESFAPETKAKRRVLTPYLMAARKQEVKASLVVDKLRIEKTTYKNVKDIPNQYSPIHTQFEGDTVLFYGKNSPLSNFHSCNFTIRGDKYSSVEQYYQSQAAGYFGDDQTKELILSLKDPAEIKRASKGIQGFNRADWYQQRAVQVMQEALHAKFTQNPDLASYLKDTGDRALAEASPYDLFWGTGVSIWAKDAGDATKWRGDNQLGSLLVDIRGSLK